MSLAEYFSFGNPWFYIASLCALGVAFINGWSDAPNAIATLITTRSMQPKKAIVMSAICNILGVVGAGFLCILIGHTSVAGTIAEIIVIGTVDNVDQALIIVAIAMASVIVFSSGATFIGYPSSESNEIVGGLTGAFIAYNIFSGNGLLDGIGWNKWALVGIGLIASLIVGFGLGLGIAKLITLICQKITRGKTTAFFRRGQICASALLALTHGIMDGLEFVGIFLMLALIATGHSDSTAVFGFESWWIILIVGLAMAGGTLLGGYRAIKTVGEKMARLEKFQAFASDLAGGVGLLLATFFSVPISTGQVKMSSILGSAASRGVKKIRWDVAGNMVLTWVIVIPGTMLLAGLLTIITLWLNGLF